MMQDVFLRGSSLISSLGKNKVIATTKMLTIKNDNYREYLNTIYEDKFFYAIKSDAISCHQKFFENLNTIITDALQDACIGESEARDLHIFIGSTSMLVSLIEEHYAESDQEILYIDGNIIGEYAKNLLKSHYEPTIIQSACTSSANALILAAQQIQNRQIKKALVIGLEVFNNVTYKGFESLMLLSKNGIYKPFDKTSDGLILGEASSAVVLDTIPNHKKTIKYISSSCAFDGYSDTGANPDGLVSYECMKNAIDKAGLTLSDFSCIKAHATGTETSNSSEAKALQKLFDFYNTKVDVVSLKPYIGHTLGACGTNEIVLFSEAIIQNQIPKTLGFKNHYDNVDFHPLTKNKILKSGFFLFHFIGFGGTNTSIVLSMDK